MISEFFRFELREQLRSPLPWLLAALLKCPAYVIACVRHGEGYRVRIEQLAERVELPTSV